MAKLSTFSFLRLVGAGLGVRRGCRGRRMPQAGERRAAPSGQQLGAAASAAHRGAAAVRLRSQRPAHGVGQPSFTAGSGPCGVLPPRSGGLSWTWRRGLRAACRRRAHRSPKMVRCQSLRATAVLSYMTCLTWVYSSNEYGRHVLAEAGRLVAAVRHLADDRDVVVDPHAAGRISRVARAGDGRRPGSTRRRPGRTGCRWPGAMPSSSPSKGRTTSTGPKTSCWTISLSCAASVDEGRLVVRALGQLAAGRLAAGDDGGVAAGPVDVAGHPVALGVRDQWAQVGGRVEAGRRAAPAAISSATPPTNASYSGRCTYARVAAVQSWPVLISAPATAP